MSGQTLPDVTPLSGWFWSWVVPVGLFAIALTATWLLYRHFANRGDHPDRRD